MIEKEGKQFTYKDLTKKQLDLLKVMLNPENITLNTKKLCAKADISTESYYRFMRDIKFKGVFKKAVEDVFEEFLPRVGASFVKRCLQGNFKHQEKFLELMGILKIKEPEIKLKFSVDSDESDIETGEAINDDNEGCGLEGVTEKEGGSG